MVQFCTTERPQLCEFEVVSCRAYRLIQGLKTLFWKLPRLICKNDEALRKGGVLACRLDTPYSSEYEAK